MITFQINGHDMEILSGCNIIQMMINYYGLKIKQIGHKIYFPIPLNLFQNGFIPCYFDHFRFLLKINTQNQFLFEVQSLHISTIFVNKGRFKCFCKNCSKSEA